VRHVRPLRLPARGHHQNWREYIVQGTVNFAGGIPTGQAAFFSLEGPVDQNLVVGPPTTGRTPTVPEPTSLLLLGTGILAFARRMRKA
jgi:hypothetical protein